MSTANVLRMWVFWHLNRLRALKITACIHITRVNLIYIWFETDVTDSLLIHITNDVMRSEVRWHRSFPGQRTLDWFSHFFSSLFIHYRKTHFKIMLQIISLCPSWFYFHSAFPNMLWYKTAYQYINKPFTANFETPIRCTFSDAYAIFCEFLSMFGPSTLRSNRQKNNNNKHEENHRALHLGARSLNISSEQTEGDCDNEWKTP